MGQRKSNQIYKVVREWEREKEVMEQGGGERKGVGGERRDEKVI